jgi:hypothetical protein
MHHPLVDQLVFTRSEFIRGMENIGDKDARRRFEPLNCIAWMMGHMAWHEQLYWLTRTQGLIPLPKLNELVAGKGPATSPSLKEMIEDWKLITRQADDYLFQLDEKKIQGELVVAGNPKAFIIGNMLQRMIYHYWYHLGESQAVRQMLGHKDLPSYIGDLESNAPYRKE